MRELSPGKLVGGLILCFLIIGGWVSLSQKDPKLSLILSAMSPPLVLLLYVFFKITQDNDRQIQNILFIQFSESLEEGTFSSTSMSPGQN